ncbi:MAG TPA: carboxypeptidase regulatory-like domain-containing protein [Candidatus Acidoferrales bacterium]|nr:carboxypeptidase regulatory-like domain-containing protein [Candidatus Acidoferrales bacterium]
MRTSVLPTALLAVCSVIAPAFCLAQQPTTAPASGDPNDQLATIAGTVVSANTGEPLKKAHVSLSQKGGGRDESSEHSLSATTDAAGHFSIDKIPADKYDLEVIHAGYMDARYGQDQIDKPGAILSLAPGQKMTDLLFRLHRTAIITGRVIDEDGDPIRGANVMSFVHTTSGGKPKILPDESDRTNDLGEYRIVDLEPGRYSIKASASHGRYSGDSESADQADNYVPVYYSGTTDIARASTLEVKSGDEISGIDFVLAPRPSVRTYKVHGHVLNSLGDYPEARIVVMLLPRGNREMAFVADQKQAVANAKTGDFELKDVMPGEYVATALSFAGGRTRTTAQNVDVIASDVDGVSLVLTRGIDIPVRVTLEGKSMPSTADVTVALSPSDNESVIYFTQRQQAVVQRDGSLELKEVGDGSYSVRVSSKCQECYLKSATANGVDLLEQGVQISSGAGPASIAIVYSSNSGTVTGAVTNKDDLPATGSMVVLVPDAKSRQKPMQSYKTSPTDQYGHFEIRGVPPGHYHAYAWEKIDQDLYGDADFVKPFEGKSESFDIAANEQKSVQLKMIPASDAAN